MKVLQVNVVYKKGSTGKITYDLHSGLMDAGIESVVCYGRGEAVHEKNVYKVSNEIYSKFNNLLSRFTGIMYGGCFFSTNKLISIIKKEKPDIVHLQCINGYFVNIYRLITWLKINHIKTVLTLHAEFMYTANCGHALDCNKWKTGCGSCPRNYAETKSILFDHTARSWKKMKKAFGGFDQMTVASVSPWLMERAKRSEILSNKNHVVVMNGVNTDVFHPYSGNDYVYAMHFDNKIIFHATAFFSDDPSHPKGGATLIRLAKEIPDVTFIVAGAYKVITDIPDNIVFLGQISNQEELAKYYSAADITVLTSKRETFSMIAVESLCCGTPVIGYEAGGPESIAMSDYSTFVTYGDFEKLKDKIKCALKQKKKKFDIRVVSECYSKETMVERYIDEYNKLLTL